LIFDVYVELEAEAYWPRAEAEQPAGIEQEARG
jgi:hypothetical protein